ncbi:Hypothetical predicted protein [Lecanosticta acicola]|uniref:Uncharacterized protein n=1 Tax=Lecanosticta acicola TaxID=111012 RepID=A0AAI9E8L6_9PEZI|nr:Hypothetical predicted protein [Lecanosticta acicola]
MHVSPPPNSREILPPLLACLHTSFVSPRPPPALLPLLSPLLRQRVNFLSQNIGNDGWLPLLSWDHGRGSKLPAVVERIDLEPHPVSGELELEEVGPAKYKRLDEETLQARLEVEQFELLPIYLWCEKDEQGGTEAGWYLSELRTLEDKEDGTEWFDSIPEADDAAKTHSISVPSTNGDPYGRQAEEEEEEEEDDANDDYWASYDRTPAERTSAKNSPAPVPSSTYAMTNGSHDGEEADYYNRYGDEVQPSMDPHDPDEDTGDIGESTLNGSSLLGSRQQPQPSSSGAIAEQADYLRSLRPHTEWKPHDPVVHTALDRSVNGEHELSMPRAISPANSTSSVDRLEERAAAMSNDGGGAAQVAIKQHISTDVKSLFILARASGMDREEFTRIVKTELDVLSLLEEDD